jgi:hypothetical protein
VNSFIDQKKNVLSTSPSVQHFTNDIQVETGIRTSC